jgi:hypothetical protein
LFVYTFFMRRTYNFPTEERLSDKCPSCEKLIRPADIVRLTIDHSRCVDCGAVYATVDIWGKSQHSDEEVADYDDGFKAGFKGRPNDDAKSEAWQRGWAQAQE